MLDEHGQPLKPFPINLVQNYGKRIDQLVGICRGILIDGEVNISEALAFRDAIEEFNCEEPGFPFDMLAVRMAAIFSPGHSDNEEIAELKTIMTDFAGLSKAPVSPPASNTLIASTASLQLPLDVPEPSIAFQGRQFVITGRYAYGTRNKVEDAIVRKGGFCHDFPILETNYLAIGHFASRDWVHTTYGRKIERAIELRRQHKTLAIISEEHLVKFLS